MYQIFWTITAGVSIFVFGQIISKFIIDPIQKQKEILGKISYALSFYGNRFPFMDDKGKIINIDELNKSSEEIRSLASDIRATRYSIPFYNLFSSIKIVPNANAIKETSTSLIGWSNSLFSNQIPNDRHHFRKEISKVLGIELE